MSLSFRILLRASTSSSSLFSIFRIFLVYCTIYFLSFFLLYSMRRSMHEGEEMSQAPEWCEIANRVERLTTSSLYGNNRTSYPISAHFNFSQLKDIG